MHKIEGAEHITFEDVGALKLKGLNAYGIEVTNLSYPFEEGEIDIIKTLISEQLLVVLPKCNLSVDQFYNLCDQLGVISTYGQYRSRKLLDNTKFYSYLDKDDCPIYPGLVRVTGEKDSKGNFLGIAPGHSTLLNWHNDQAGRDAVKVKRNDKIKGIWSYERPLPEVIALQGVKGTKGSITEICQLVDSFNAEDLSTKNWFKSIRLKWGYVDGEDKIYDSGVVHKEDKIERILPIVTKAINGKEGLHFSPSQTVAIDGKSEKEYNELKEYIMKNYVNPNYIYRHYWNDGDIIFTDQKTSIHRRVGTHKETIPMQKLSKRLLHHVEIHIHNLNNAS